jgi:16S rRNA (cytidine1402-2'-O)-methyltransferase
MAGSLYILATPIGNLRDMTLRALDILREVDIIVVEDTRRTSSLLKHYAIHKKKLLSCHKFNEKSRASHICELLSQGKMIAFVSDSGTPGISDPGSFVVKQATLKGFKVIVIPGASALTAAVSVSGMKQNGFVFMGFLGKKLKDLKKVKDIILQTGMPVIFYESPKRIIKTLTRFQEFMPESEVVLCRELTKMHEEILRGDLENVLQNLEKRGSIRGEMVVILREKE